MVTTMSSLRRNLILLLSLASLWNIRTVSALDYRVVGKFPVPPDVTGLTQGMDGGLVTDGSGNFYGVHRKFGENGKGFVFRMTEDGTVSIIHSFAGPDGEDPRTQLTAGRDGCLYGTTYAGGAFGSGTVFKIRSDGALTTLWSFSGTNGAGPLGRILEHSDGHLYGTTWDGGDAGLGTVFRLTKTGNFLVMYNFTELTGSHPRGGVVEGPDRALYGTANMGGTKGKGVLYKLTTTGDFKVLRHMEGNPVGELSHSGGVSFTGADERSRVFKITSTGKYTELGDAGVSSVVIGGDGSAGLGGSPIFADFGFSASLTCGIDGSYFGTTGFRVLRAAGGPPFQTVAVIPSFRAWPNSAPLCVDDAGNLWGTTNGQPGVDFATVFVLTSGRQAAAGNYVARFHDNSDSHASSGLIDLKLSISGTFTGKIRFAGSSHVLSGRLDELGDLKLTVSRGGALPPILLSLHLNIEDDIVNRLTGDVRVGAGVFPFDARRCRTYWQGPPSQLGRLTARLTPPQTAGLPGGHGYAAAKITKGGSVSIAGKLPDLTPFTAGSRLNRDGSFPIYAPLCAGKLRGSLRADIVFDDQEESDANATVRWDKPQQTAGRYPAGFTTNLDFSGSKYTSPSLGVRVLDWADASSNGNLQLFGPPPDRIMVSSTTFTLQFNNTAVPTPESATRPIIVFSKRDGIFSGSLLVDSRRAPFRGVILQKARAGFGICSIPGRTQAIELTPNE